MAILYSTGPLEQENTGVDEVRVKVLNNSPTDTATVRIRVFDLNGTKIRIANALVTIPPQASAFRTFGVAGTNEYEVQVRIELDGATDQQIESFVLPSVWGRDGGVPVAVHRLVTDELKLVRPIRNT